MTPEIAPLGATDADRFPHWLPWLLLAAYAVCLQLWVESDWRSGWDSALYILTGRSLQAGEGYRYLDQPFILRPPGLPWLLSFLPLGLPFHAEPLNRLMMAFAASSVAALYFAVSGIIGRGPALAIALLFGTSTVDVQLFNKVVSEYPFATLFFFAAGCLERASPRENKGRLWAALGAAALAGAFYMRSAALLAVPVLALAALRGAPHARRNGWLAALIAAVLVAPWLWHTRSVGASLPATDQLMLTDYLTAALRSNPADPASAWISPFELLQRIGANGAGILRDLGRTLLNSGSLAAGAIVALLSLVGLWIRARRGFGMLEGFAFLYSLLLLSYFSYDTRLLFPLVPLAYYYAYASLRQAGDWLSPGRANPWVRRAPPLAGLAVAMLVNLATLPRNLDPSRWESSGTQLVATWHDVRSTAAWINQNTTSSDVILCDWAPVYGVLTGRRSYTYRFAGGLSLLERSAPDYVIVENSGRARRALKKRVAKRSLEQWSLPSQSAREAITIHRMTPFREPSGFSTTSGAES